MSWQQRDLGDLDDLDLAEPQLLGHGRGDADDRLGVLRGVPLARLERGQQRLAGDRLALQPRRAAAVELVLDLVGDHPGEHLQHLLRGPL